MIPIRLHALPLLALPLAPIPAAAQELPPPAEWTMVVSGTQRWLHGRQPAAFTALAGADMRIEIDSIVPGPAPEERTLFTRLRDDTVTVTHGARGRPVRIRVTLPEAERKEIAGIDPLTRQGWRAMDDAGVALPESRLWDLVPATPAGPLQAGARWRDPVDLHAEYGPFRQSLRGERISTVVRDTVVDGRRLWIIRDSAAVQYQERWMRMERTLNAAVQLERTAAGTVRGRHLYDPALKLFHTRADTARYTGQAVQRYPDGRTFRTPARYERVRAWALHDSAAIVRHDSLRADSLDRDRRGVIGFPVGSVEERLAQGDSALADSVVQAWHRSRNAEERETLENALVWDPEEVLEHRDFDRMRLQAGDTAAYIESMLRRVYVPQGQPVNADDLARMLPFMEDPGLSFAWGIDLDPFYENTAQGLLFAIPAIERDSSRWSCTPAACRLLMARYDSGREPRLRALGLVARMVFDPRRWADTVLAVADTVPLLREAAGLVRGAAVQRNGGPEFPLPPPDAEWRAWRAWMTGLPGAAPLPAPPAAWLQWGAGHVRAVRFQELLTGRRIVDELRERFASAQSDSARLVFGAAVLGMGETIHSPAQIAALLQSSSAADRELGKRQVMPLFDAALPADSATAEQLVNRLLEIQLEGAPVWTPLEGGDNRVYVSVMGEGDLPRVLLGDSLPPGVARSWAGRASVLDTARMNSLGRRDAGVRVYVTPPRVVGPFATVGLRFSAYYPRDADQTPAASMGMWQAWLLRTADGWVMIMQGGSIS